MHTRQAADPQAALDLLRGPLDGLAARHGLAVEPGRMVIELRPPGMDKGQALRTLVQQRGPSAVMFCGDDLGDAAAFGAVRALRGEGVPGLTVFSGSAEVTALAEGPTWWWTARMASWPCSARWPRPWPARPAGGRAAAGGQPRWKSARPGFSW